MLGTLSSCLKRPMYAAHERTEVDDSCKYSAVRVPRESYTSCDNQCVISSSFGHTISGERVACASARLL